RQFRVAVEGAGEYGEWTQVDDGDLFRRLADQFDEQLVTLRRRVQLGAGHGNAAEAVRAVQGGAVDFVCDRRRGPEARPFWRVELVDQDVNVGGRLVGGDVAG